MNRTLVFGLFAHFIDNARLNKMQIEKEDAEPGVQDSTDLQHEKESQVNDFPEGFVFRVVF